MTGRRWRWVAGGAVALGVLATACTQGSSDEDSATVSDAATQTAGDAAVETGGAPAEQSAGDEAGGGSEAAGTPLAVDTLAVTDREIVRTGDVQLVVDDVEAAAEDVRQAADAADGFVADEQTLTRSARVDMTVRVPAADFEDVRAAVADLGDVVEQNVQAQDVTAEVVDVETRIASLQASVERLQGLLGGAGDVGQLATVEGELAGREVELEALLGQQRVLRDQVDLATLQVTLSEDEQPAPDEDAAGFGDGLRTGWVAVVDGGRFVLAAAGFLLPFAPFALVAALAVRWYRRRRPAGTTIPPAPIVPPAPAGPSTPAA